MRSRRSTGAIFWGLTLTAIGALLLLRNFGYPIPIWGYVARYWPALLIGWGVLKIVDYYRLRNAGDSQPLFSGWEVALLIFVIFAGTAVTTAANISSDLGNIFEIGDIDLWDITGNNFTFDEHREAPVPSGSNIEIVNFYGNVDVRPSDSDRVVLDVKKTLRASNKEEAERLSKDFTFSISNIGSGYRIASNRESGVEFGGIPRQRYKSSLTIQVPKRSALRLNNRNGKVSIQAVDGTQEVSNRYGQVDVHNITGTVQVENRNGSVTVQDVTESVRIRNRFSVTAVKSIGGSLDVENRNGSVDVSGVKGNVSISNSYAAISVENVQGALTIDSRNGDLFMSLLIPPQKDIQISSRYGNVTLELPSNSSFSIDAQIEFGEIHSEFQGLKTAASNRERSLNGRVGAGGPQIMIAARNGTIHLGRKG